MGLSAIPSADRSCLSIDPELLADAPRQNTERPKPRRRQYLQVSRTIWRIPKCHLSRVTQRRWPDRIVVTLYALSTYDETRPAMIHDTLTSIGTEGPQLQVLGGRTVDGPAAESLGWKPWTAWRGRSQGGEVNSSIQSPMPSIRWHIGQASRSSTDTTQFPFPVASRCVEAGDAPKPEGLGTHVLY